MDHQLIDEGIDPSRSGEFDLLEAHLESRLNGRVRALHVLLRGNGLILQGRAPTYYLKQLAQNAVLQASELPILANEIEVTRGAMVFPGCGEQNGAG